MKRIVLNAYAKINLSLDVLGVMDDGYHRVEMVMQQIMLHDKVDIKWYENDCDDKSAKIQVSTNRHYIPKDERNLAYKASLLMVKKFGEDRKGRLRTDIKKNIPVAAGLAGGSSNAAAVLHGVNELWHLGLSVKELCSLGSELGADVPFCVMGQARGNRFLKAVRKDPMACSCALATGTGVQLKQVKGLDSYIVLSKPPISVSTPEVYRGIDGVEIKKRPNTDRLLQGLREKNKDTIEKNMVNVLENFTLKRYPIVMYTKDKIQDLCPKSKVLMSGSGPSVFALMESKEQAMNICSIMSRENKETFWTRTMK